MVEKFIDWSPKGATQVILVEAVRVLDQYEAQGYRLTLRQLYYQLVAGGHVANNLRVYKQVGDVVNNARLAGIVDWDRIEDRVRVPQANSHWENPRQIVEAAIKSYYKSRWERQEEYVEVWCEKDAVSNIVEPVCRKWDVVFMANRGYSSQSAMYEGYQRFLGYQDRAPMTIIYLGDHDPSGMDMVDDVQRRMDLFFGGRSVVVRRVALNADQIKKYGPPENPAKATDSRYEGYRALYGDSSWELDALEPSVLAAIVEVAVSDYVDTAAWEAVEKEEEADKARLRSMGRKL